MEEQVSGWVVLQTDRGDIQFSVMIMELILKCLVPLVYLHWSSFWAVLEPCTETSRSPDWLLGRVQTGRPAWPCEENKWNHVSYLYLVMTCIIHTVWTELEKRKIPTSDTAT